jgi:hypothetical protein
MDRLLHGRLPIRYGDRLVAIATHFNHAGFVIMARLVTGCVAEVDIDPPDPVAEPTKRRMHNSFYVIGKLLATMDVAVCSNLDQHRRLHGCMRQPRIYRVLLAFQSQKGVTDLPLVSRKMRAQSFKNWRQPDHKNLCCREHRPWLLQHI